MTDPQEAARKLTKRIRDLTGHGDSGSTMCVPVDSDPIPVRNRHLGEKPTARDFEYTLSHRRVQELVGLAELGRAALGQDLYRHGNTQHRVCCSETHGLLMMGVWHVGGTLTCERTKVGVALGIRIGAVDFRTSAETWGSACQAALSWLKDYMKNMPARQAAQRGPYKLHPADNVLEEHGRILNAHEK